MLGIAAKLLPETQYAAATVTDMSSGRPEHGVKSPTPDRRRTLGETRLEFLTKLPLLTAFAFTLMLTLVLPRLLERLRLPGPVGYILAGIILGPQFLGILKPEGQVINFFSEIGKLLLMFFAASRSTSRSSTAPGARLHDLRSADLRLSFRSGDRDGGGAGLSAERLRRDRRGAGLAHLARPATHQAGGPDGPRSVVATVGATVFTDLLSIFVLAVCLPIHLELRSQGRADRDPVARALCTGGAHRSELARQTNARPDGHDEVGAGADHAGGHGRRRAGRGMDRHGGHHRRLPGRRGAEACVRRHAERRSRSRS